MRVSQDATPANPLMIEQRINRARAVADSDIVTQIAAAAERRTGRPRLIPLDAVIAGFVLHASGQPHTMTMAGLWRTLRVLTPNQLATLGFPVGVTPRYKRIRSSWRAVLRVVSSGILIDHDHELEVDTNTGELAPCPMDCPHLSVTLEEFLTRLIQASLPPGYERSTTVAVDGTDVESHTRPHKKRLDSQGRAFWSADHDARWGHRTATDRRPTEHFLGYEAHVATYVPDVGEAPLPQLAAGLALRPGVRDRTSAVLGIFDCLPGIREGLLDRGYTTAKGEKLAGPLRDRHIQVTMDLHKTQRGQRPGPIPGTIWLDGHLYTACIPERLRELEPPTLHMTEAEKAHLRDVFDAREPYRFVAHGKHNKRDAAPSASVDRPSMGIPSECAAPTPRPRCGSRTPSPPPRASRARRAAAARPSPSRTPSTSATGNSFLGRARVGRSRTTAAAASKGSSEPSATSPSTSTGGSSG